MKTQKKTNIVQKDGGEIKMSTLQKCSTPKTDLIQRDGGEERSVPFIPSSVWKDVGYFTLVVSILSHLSVSG